MRRCFRTVVEVSVFVSLGIDVSSVAKEQRAFKEKVGCADWKKAR
jgi:hypothetical protein